MVSAERIEGIFENWCEERFEPDMGEEWRDSLSVEEAEIVAKWDERYAQRLKEWIDRLHAERDA